MTSALFCNDKQANSFVSTANKEAAERSYHNLAPGFPTRKLTRALTSTTPWAG